MMYIHLVKRRERLIIVLHFPSGQASALHFVTVCGYTLTLAPLQIVSQHPSTEKSIKHTKQTIIYYTQTDSCSGGVGN